MRGIYYYIQFLSNPPISPVLLQVTQNPRKQTCEITQTLYMVPTPPRKSWKVLDFFFKIPGPGKSWKIALVLEIEV